MFVKSFVDNAKDAPSDIPDLRLEMDILARQASKISTLITNSNQPQHRINSCMSALRQCIDAITALGQKIQNDVTRFEGDGTGKWWDRVKAAARKKGIAEHILKIERAKTQLIMVMQEFSTYVNSPPCAMLT